MQHERPSQQPRAYMHMHTCQSALYRLQEKARLPGSALNAAEAAAKDHLQQEGSAYTQYKQHAAGMSLTAS